MVINVLKLMRIQNLLFVMGAQILMRYAVAKPILNHYNMQLQLPTYQFLLLLLATFLVLGAGYIINGYFDTRIDAINKPDGVIVGRSISRRFAITLHQIFSIIGILIGLFLGWRTGKYETGLAFVFIVGLLWFYSASYKRQFLIGNLMIALIAGVTLLFVIVFEGADLLRVYTDPAHENVIAVIWTYVLCYALFFTLVSFLLGIIKDQITEPGDRELECHTIPIVWGSKGAKVVISLLVLLLLGYLGHLYYHGMLSMDAHWIFLRYLLSLVVLPSIVCLIMNIKGGIPKDYIWSYRSAQAALLFGMLFSVLNWYLITH